MGADEAELQCERACACCVDDPDTIFLSRLECMCVVCRDWLEENCRVARTEPRATDQSGFEQFQ